MTHEGPHGFLGMIFHPALVHFPIAFYVLELILLTAWALDRGRQYRVFAQQIFFLGFFIMLAAMSFGYWDAMTGGGIRGLVKKHFDSALVLLAVSSLRAVYWRFSRETRRWDTALLLAGAFLNAFCVIKTAYWGGRLIYS